MGVSAHSLDTALVRTFLSKRLKSSDHEDVID